MATRIDRREFLQKAALAGLAVFAPGVHASRAFAAGPARQSAPYAGPFWIFVNANGGWDPTDLCDPKGRASATAAEPVNTYLTGDILTAGNITYAPHEGFAPFFNKHASKMLVIRGIDLSTNGHSEGLRHSFSGRLPDGNPSLAALIAATYAPQLPTSFLTAGGFDATMGVVGATRIGNPAVLQSIAFPNRINPNAMGDGSQRTFQDEFAAAKIDAYRASRLDRLRGGARLHRVRQSMNELYTAGLDQETLKQVSEFMPATLSNDRFESQVQISMAAYKAGATISMSMGFGGFDTHGNHDASHIPQLLELLGKVDFIWNEADRLQIADRVAVVMTSEMGRTPHYNSGNGKDHWSITSAMLMGPGIPGNKVIGQTTEVVEAKRINPTSLAVLEKNDEAGVVITPAIVHDNLRRLAGVSETLQRDFPIYPERDINLFAPPTITP